MKAAAASREIKHKLRKLSNGSDSNYVPPKQLLLYLVRMGSFTSKPRVSSEENPDADLEFPPTSSEELLARCRTELKGFPAKIERSWRRQEDSAGQNSTVRVLQWNHLSQCLATKCDKLVKTDPEALVWTTRRWRILEELLHQDADIICLQEVDHFDLLERALGSVGYSGKFLAKPDSPCIYMEGNTGPDGCAIFFKTEKFSVVEWTWRVLEVWRVESNQVVLCAVLRHRTLNTELCVVTTHLKARKGALLSTLRAEQGADIISWLSPVTKDRPVILTGDFNAPPSEPVYSTITSSPSLPLASAYSLDTLQWTTWKIRDSGEEKYVLDYIFHSPGLRSEAVLETPSPEEVGLNRLPSVVFPSDHLSLVADISIQQ